MTFRDNVNQVLERKGITKSQLADLLQKSRQNVSVILKNNKPSLQTIEEFAAALGVDKSELLLKTPVERDSDGKFALVDWDLDATASQYVNQPGVRFVYYVDAMGYSKEKVLVDTGITISSTKVQENYELRLSARDLRNIIRSYDNLNPAWLLDGKGSMTIEPNEGRNKMIRELIEMINEGDDKRSEENSNSKKLELLRNNDGTEFRVMPDSSILILSPLIQEGSFSAYIDGHSNIDFVSEELPKHATVSEKIQLGVYRSFELVGDHMNSGREDSITDGSIVTGYRYNRKYSARMFEWAYEPRRHFVLVCNDKIKVTEIKSFDNSKDEFVCQDSNPATPEFYKIASKDILELYVIVAITQYRGEWMTERIFRKNYEPDED